MAFSSAITRWASDKIAAQLHVFQRLRQKIHAHSRGVMRLAGRDHFVRERQRFREIDAVERHAENGDGCSGQAGRLTWWTSLNLQIISTTRAKVQAWKFFAVAAHGFVRRENFLHFAEKLVWAERF